MAERQDSNSEECEGGSNPKGGRRLTMRLPLFCLALAIAARSANAELCVGAETRLSEVLQHLERHETAKAEALLAPIESSYPDCTEILLAKARIRAANNDPAGAQ